MKTHSEVLIISITTKIRIVTINVLMIMWKLDELCLVRETKKVQLL